MSDMIPNIIAGLIGCGLALAVIFRIREIIDMRRELKKDKDVTDKKIRKNNVERFRSAIK